MTFPYIRVTIKGKPDLVFTEKEWVDYGAYNGFTGKDGRPMKKDVKGVETIYQELTNKKPKS